ncbi:TPA: DUF4754 family protein [Escherichia coli]
MKRAYKELINHALQNYHYGLTSRGTNGDAVSLAALTTAIKGLTCCAFGSGDNEALTELQAINKDLSERNVITPFVIQEEA